MAMSMDTLVTALLDLSEPAESEARWQRSVARLPDQGGAGAQPVAL